MAHWRRPKALAEPPQPGALQRVRPRRRTDWQGIIYFGLIVGGFLLALTRALL